MLKTSKFSISTVTNCRRFVIARVELSETFILLDNSFTKKNETWELQLNLTQFKSGNSEVFKRFRNKDENQYCFVKKCFRIIELTF